MDDFELVMYRELLSAFRSDQSVVVYTKDGNMFDYTGDVTVHDNAPIFRLEYDPYGEGSDVYEHYLPVDQVAHFKVATEQ